MRGGRRAASATSKLGLYALVPALGALTPLLAWPVITHTYGSSGWTAIAIGQSVGAGASVLVELGWALTGPQEIARAPHERRQQIFAHSVATKAIAYALLIPTVIVATSLLASEYEIAASAAAVAMLTNGLSANWYFIGLGKPSLMIIFDAVPRVLGTVLGSCALLAGAALQSYTWAVLVFTLLGVIAATSYIARDADWMHAFRRSEIRRTYRSQLSALTARVASAIYMSLSVALVQLASPSAAPAFAAADRLVRMELLVLQSVPTAFQRFLGSARPSDLAHRLRTTIIVQVFLGITCGVATWLLLPVGVEVLLRDTISVSGLSVFAGLVVMLTCFSRATGLALVALKSVRWIAISAISGGVLAASAIVPLVKAHGAAGGVAGVVAAESLVLGVQCLGLILTRRSSSFSMIDPGRLSDAHTR